MELLHVVIFGLFWLQVELDIEAELVDISLPGLLRGSLSERVAAGRSRRVACLVVVRVLVLNVGAREGVVRRVESTRWLSSRLLRVLFDILHDCI